MPSEKEIHLLKSADYSIKGNSIRAFYDKRGKLVFVLDSTITKSKPNVLLVLVGHGNRKWDDILANDYGMDLELVRPKKNNKYQKLDVEYDGLDIYDNLIQAYQDDKDVQSELKELEDFQIMAARKSASERFDVASAVAENARDTIERTNDAITELRAKIKVVRSKLTVLRSGVGREPTKQSAAKILKAEAQLDVLTDKLKRAKKRLENANKRLLLAEDDMAAARAVLDMSSSDKSKSKGVVKSRNVALGNQGVVKKTQDEELDNDFDDEEVDGDDIEDNDVSDDAEWQDEEIDIDEEQDLDDTDVKPLFNKDPKILNDNIAFKPISFDDEKHEDNIETEDDADKDDVVVEKETPVSFVPPKSIMDVVSVPEKYDASSDTVKFDDVFSEGVSDEVKYDADVPEEKTDSEDWTGVEAAIKDMDDEEDKNDVEIKEHDAIDVRPVVGAVETVPEPVAEPAVSIEQPLVEPRVVPIVDNVSETARPTLPLGVTHVVPDVSATPIKHKPNLLYYVLLLVLIALSVFTLWLYQRSNVVGNGMPELIAANGVVVSQNSGDIAKSEDVAEDDASPFIETQDAQEQKEPQSGSVIVKSVETSLNKIAKVADVQTRNDKDALVDVSETVDVTDDNDAIGKPVVSAEVAETVVDKPEYKVAPEDVFTTDSDDNSSGDCDGAGADEHGCCPGETYTDMGEAGFNCCPADGGDCFPPLSGYSE